MLSMISTPSEWDVVRSALASESPTCPRRPCLVGARNLTAPPLLPTQLVAGSPENQMYAWEGSFSDRVGAVREQEVRHLRHSERIKACNAAVFQAAPLVAAATTFAIYVGTGNRLTAATAFAALGWTNVLLRPLRMIPKGSCRLLLDPHLGLPAPVSAPRVTTISTASCPRARRRRGSAHGRGFGFAPTHAPLSSAARATRHAADHL